MLVILVGTATSIVVVITLVILILLYIKRRKQEKTDGKVIKGSNTMTRLNAKPHHVCIEEIVNGNVRLPPIHEFENLTHFEETLTQRWTRAQGRRYNKNGFNLNPEVLPFDRNMVRLRNAIDGCSYVNCSWISQDSDEGTYDQLIYTTYLPYFKIKFAVGQDPLPRTIKHHYSMIHENRFDFVVTFEEENTYNTPMELGKEYHFHNITVRVDNRTQLDDNLVRCETILSNVSNPGAQYEHRLIHFEFNAWPKQNTSYEDTQNIITGICLIRSELNLEKSSLKILLHDSEGGICESAAFLALYRLMQNLDESFTENNEIKTSAEGIDVFKTVNKLREDRAGMVNSYATYKLLFLGLQYYGVNRIALKAVKSKILKRGSASRQRNNTSAPGIRGRNESIQNSSVIEVNDGIGEYILHEPSGRDSDGPFDDYYDDRFEQYTETRHADTNSSANDEGIEYVMHDNPANGSNCPFDYYYD